MHIANAKEPFPELEHSALQRHFTKNSKQIFPEMKLRVSAPHSYIDVPVGDLYITRISLPILLQQNWLTNPGNI
jgi:hypothetical protein